MRYFRHQRGTWDKLLAHNSDYDVIKTLELLLASPVILRLCYNTLFSTVALSRLFDCYMTKYTIMLTAAPGSLS